MLRDLYSELKLISGKATAVTDTTATVSAIVDTRDYERVMFAIVTGTLADADATFTTLLEESDASDLSGSNAVDDADMVGTEALASFLFSDDASVFKLGYIGTKRYIRLTITPAANSGAAPIGVIAIGKPLRRPAT